MASTSGTIELRDHYSSHPQNSRQIRPHPSDENSTATTAVDVSFLRRSATVVVLAGVTANGPLCNGILTVALPSVAKDIKLSSNLILWPASVFGLAAGCTLLIFGSLADVVGAKRIWLTGISLYTVFTLGCGLVQTGFQIIIFRVVTGIALAMCLPTSVGIITKAFPPGKGRNTAFSIIGVSQPFGFSVGLVAGGAFVNTIGWRSGFYISAALAAILIPGGFWALPVDDSWGPSNWVRLRTEIDWVGASLISVAFAIISYVLGVVSLHFQNMKAPRYILLLIFSVLLLPVFGYWVGRREKLGKSALIPPSIWKNATFTSTCLAVFLSFAAFNAVQYFCTLYLQLIQGLSPLQTSIRLLPQVIVGVVVNILTGYLVDKVSVRVLVGSSAFITAVAPLILALSRDSWSYWEGIFVGDALAPVNPDVLFTVSNLIIAGAFPDQQQALAGGVFNSIAQMGNSVGLGVCAAIAASATGQVSIGPDQLMRGYRAAFWTMFASTILVCLIALLGLGKAGKVGRKQD